MRSDLLKIKVAIVDDHPLVIEGLKSLLRPYDQLKVVGSFNSGKEILAFLKNAKADIVLLDINLPDTNGVEVCGQIRKEHPDVDVYRIEYLRGTQHHQSDDWEWGKRLLTQECNRNRINRSHQESLSRKSLLRQ